MCYYVLAIACQMQWAKLYPGQCPASMKACGKVVALAALHAVLGCAASCPDPWAAFKISDLDAVMPELEPRGTLDLDRCDIEVFATDAMIDRAIFSERLSLRTPFVVRNSSANEAARSILADRCAVIRDHGHTKVDIGSPFSLTVAGSASLTTTLKQYLETPFAADAPLYFFDKPGRWADEVRGLRDVLETPPYIWLEPQSKAPIFVAIGQTGSGIGLHAHQDGWNQIAFGSESIVQCNAFL